MILRCQKEEENWVGEDNEQPNEPSVRRKISSEISSLAVAQHIDSWSSNLIELFTDGNRKSSSTNMNSGTVFSFKKILFYLFNIKTLKIRLCNNGFITIEFISRKAL